MKNEINRADAFRSEGIPTLADLALKYGTISREQHAYLVQLFTFKKEQISFDVLLRDEGLATPHQLGLLKLLQEYHIIRKSGEEFGQIAIAKGLATKADISRALEFQKVEFRKSKNKKRIGDILVESQIITTKQKDLILKEQNQFSKQNGAASYKESQSLEDTEQGRGETHEDQFEISIRISSDHMSAWMERPRESEIPISLSQVKEAVMNYGIVNGIYPDPFIQSFLDAGIKKFPIAQVDCFNLLKQQSNFCLYIKDDKGCPTPKKRGEVLAEQNVAAVKIKIENLYGEFVSGTAENTFIIECGENTRRSKDNLKILAVKSGRPMLSASRKMVVHPVVNILEDADYRYGPIEPYADLSVSGTIFGAYPITAGNIDAEEIRDADIEATGDIHIRVGISDAIIRTQGDVHARYLHNCRLETFGNVYIQNEIIDSQIRCGGKLEGLKCRVISSKIYAKGGILLSGVGSDRSVPSSIIAGGEHHAVGIARPLLDRMNAVLRKLEDLKEEKCEQQSQAEKIFNKMVELKAFHDKAQKKKDVLLRELNKKKEKMHKKVLENIQNIIITCDKRMNSVLITLKGMNVSKKEHDDCVEALENKISSISEQTEKEIFSLERTLFAYMEKSRESNGVPIIEIKGLAHAGTRLGGIYQVLTLEEDKKGFKVEEVQHQGVSSELQVTSPLPTA